jgi:hypothetical protein
MKSMDHSEIKLRKKVFASNCYISKSSNSGKGNRSRAAIPDNCASSGKEIHNLIRNMKIKFIK